MRSLVEWAVVLLGVCAISLVVIAWQFVGFDVGAAWAAFWDNSAALSFAERGVRFLVAFLFFSVFAALLFGRRER